jgi:DNA-binding response OmpR family regulator
MIDLYTPQRPRFDWHCLVASDDAETIAEVSYHVLRLGLTVSTTGAGSDLYAAIQRRVPQLVVVSDALLAVHGHALRRDVREATGRWGLALIVVVHADVPADLDADAVIRLPQPGGAIRAVVRRVVERVATHVAAADAEPSPPVVVRREARELRVRGRWVRLSEMEFRLVEALLRTPRGLADGTLERHVWGAPQRRGFRGLITVTARLRKKLAPYGVAVDRAPELPGYRLRWDADPRG